MRASRIRNRSATSTRVLWSDLRRSPAWRGICLTLAVLAVAFKVLVPAGFMAAAPTNDLPFPLVLCTGQGALVVAPGDVLPGHEEQGTDGKAAPHNPCLFAGHGVGAPAPNLLDASRVEFITYAASSPVTPAFTLAPGRGLAAPPLPARGPPSLLI